MGDHLFFVVLIAYSALWRVGVPDHCKKFWHRRDVGQLSIGMNGGIRGLAQEQRAGLSLRSVVWLDPQFSGARDSGA